MADMAMLLPVLQRRVFALGSGSHASECDTLSDTLMGGRKRKPADGVAAESVGFLGKNTGWMDADGHQSFS